MEGMIGIIECVCLYEQKAKYIQHILHQNKQTQMGSS